MGWKHLAVDDKRYLEKMKNLIIQGSRSLFDKNCYNSFCGVVLGDLYDYKNKVNDINRGWVVDDIVHKMHYTLNKINENPKNIEKYLKDLEELK